jgi:hypothetical protein
MAMGERLSLEMGGEHFSRVQHEAYNVKITGVLRRGVSIVAV